jgi:hypothetical protein
MITQPTYLELFPVGDARISECGEYRYSLTREVGAGAGSVLWIMLNPSTADASRDDPTIRRCKGFTRLWGFGRIEVVNLFAYRATDPLELSSADDPIGPENMHTITQCKYAHDRVVLAWGGKVPHKFRWHAKAVASLFTPDVLCLGTNKGGSPKHPLYVPYDFDPQRYRAP